MFVIKMTIITYIYSCPLRPQYIRFMFNCNQLNNISLNCVRNKRPDHALNNNNNYRFISIIHIFCMPQHKIRRLTTSFLSTHVYCSYWCILPYPYYIKLVTCSKINDFRIHPLPYFHTFTPIILHLKQNSIISIFN